MVKIAVRKQTMGLMCKIAMACGSGMENFRVSGTMKGHKIVRLQGIKPLAKRNGNAHPSLIANDTVSASRIDQSPRAVGVVVADTEAAMPKQASGQATSHFPSHYPGIDANSPR